MARAELTHIDRVPIDMALADAQHAFYRAALVQCGAAVMDLPALDDHPDCAFVEDTAVILPELTILCRPGAASRRAETATIRAVLPADRPISVMAAPATIDGGDVLVIGHEIFIGLSSRTNRAAIDTVKSLVAPYGYRVMAIAVPAALHLKTAVTALTPGEVLINPAWIDPSAFGTRTVITVAADEPFGANALPIAGRIVYAAEHVRTADRLRAAGYQVVPVGISEFAKAEAGVTCLSVIIPAGALGG
jgi:dimethylargininase